MKLSKYRVYVYFNHNYFFNWDYVKQRRKIITILSSQTKRIVKFCTGKFKHAGNLCAWSLNLKKYYKKILKTLFSLIWLIAVYLKRFKEKKFFHKLYDTFDLLLTVGPGTFGQHLFIE